MMIQPRLKNESRTSRSAALIKEIDTAIEHTAKRFNCSKGFVIATGMAEFFGINRQADYRDYTPRKRKNKRNRS